MLEIVRRYHGHDPVRRGIDDSVAEDWVRKLQEYPLASVFAVYDRQIEQPGKWLLSLGDFVEKVRLHAFSTRALSDRVQAAIGRAA